MTEPIAIIMAAPPGFNPGMLLSELAARAFCRRNGVEQRVTYYRFVNLVDRLGGMDERRRAATLSRCDVGIKFEYLSNPSALRGQQILYWGDFLHMRQYILNMSNVFTQFKRSEKIEEILLLANADPESISRAVSCGTTTLFNSANDLCDPAYGPFLKALVCNMKLILLRDMVSAAQIGSLAGRPGKTFLGVDTVQFMTLHDDWHEIFGPGAEFPGAEDGIGLAFFARTQQNPELLNSVIGKLGRSLNVEFRWLPWGDRSAFPFLQPQLPSDLGLATIHNGEHILLNGLMEAVSRARVVVTDTYHLAVAAWSIGIPAVMVEGDYWPGERDVNAGHRNSRIDKRKVFYAQHSLLEFYLSRSVANDAGARQGALDHMLHLISETPIAAWHRLAVRNRAAWTDARVGDALGGTAP